MCAIADARALIQVLKRDVSRVSLGEDLGDIEAVSLITSSTVTRARMSIDELSTFRRIVATTNAAGQQWRRWEIVVLMLDTFDMKNRSGLAPDGDIHRQRAAQSHSWSVITHWRSSTVADSLLLHLFFVYRRLHVPSLMLNSTLDGHHFMHDDLFHSSSNVSAFKSSASTSCIPRLISLPATVVRRFSLCS